MTRRRWLIVGGSVVGGVVVVAVAFGLYFWFRGSTPSPQAATWADQVCTSVATWETQVKTIATNVNGIPSKATVEAKVDQADAATRTLVSDLKTIGVPETPNGQAAQAEVEALVETARADFETIKTEAGQLNSGGVTGFASGLATIATQVTDLLTNVRSTVDDLKGLSPDLRNAIIHNSTCRSIG